VSACAQVGGGAEGEGEADSSLSGGSIPEQDPEIRA